MRRKKLHFRIEGQDLTQLVRTLWADEGQPDKALRILHAAFPDMTRTQQLSILCGEKQLSGNEHEMRLIDDDTEVSDLGNALDAEAVFAKLQTQSRTDRETSRDVIALLTHDTRLMGSPKGGVYIARHRVQDIRNGKASIDQVPHIESSINLRKDPTSRREIPLGDLQDTEPQERTTSLTIPCHAQYKITTDNGWLSPEGRFYPCDWMQHDNIAHQLGFEVSSVEKLGWIRITSNYGPLEPLRPPTQKQADMLWDWLSKQNRPMPIWYIENKDDIDQLVRINTRSEKP